MSFLCFVVILALCGSVKSCIIHSILGADGNYICCPGYNHNADGECVQSCENCEHGICLGHNICICRYGKIDGKCVGYCESQCRNGHCINGSCFCNEGYKKPEIKASKTLDYFYSDDYDYHEEDLQSCQPICKSCENGKCLSPDVCQCNKGYERKGDRCMPICTGCDMGVCLAPNQCTCLAGYKMNASTCVPQCYGQCPEGKCIRPGVCKCEEGFKWSLYQERCLPNCIYSLCKENEVCDMTTTGRCVCKKGYKRNELSSKCEPVCDNVCVNGFCSAPNVCSCNANFTHKNSTHCDLKCDPICPRYSVCVNGTCECFKNFKKGNIWTGAGNICLPNCNCKNGVCLLLNDKPECLCKSGYVKNPNNSSECITECERDGCDNGFCGNSGQECICHLHYKKDLNGKCVKCEPGTFCNGAYVPFTCDPPCQHGICIQNNTCACNHGYDKTEKSHICEPICKGGCANGVCKTPHNCECNEGYEKVDEKCQPVCEHQCVNGICIAPNTCNCTEEHEFVLDSKHKCEKKKCKDCNLEGAALGIAAIQEKAVSDEENSSVPAMVLFSLLIFVGVSAIVVGTIFYLKSRRNASFPLMDSFVYNRMSE